MVLFYLTVVTLDIALGVTWWATKTAVQGLYYGINYMIYGTNIYRTTNKQELLQELQKLQKQIEYTRL